MTLRELVGRADLPDVSVSGLSGDSRQVQPGDAFVACAGQAFDGHAFVPEAVRRGATAVLSERAVKATVPVAVLPDLAHRRGELAARFHGSPSERLTVVGVTGTNGKTTVAHSLAAAMPRAAFAGTVGWGFPKALRPAALTTEDPITVQARLRTLLDAGADSVAMEVSSHALEQGRVQEVAFDVAVFTNLSRDHLDYHGSMERYADAKKKLFQRDLRAAVANIDDATGRSILAETNAAGIDSFGFGAAADADVSWSNVRYEAQGLTGTWHTPWGKASFKAPGFFGEFSLRNLAATLTAECALGVSLDDAAASMLHLPPPPGRMQAADEAATPLVLIDYAHTPDALKAALAAVRQHLPGTSRRRLVTVFGCGGDRDRGKRAAMAQAAEAGADAVFLTSDNPRGEDPERILDDAMQGFREPDRVRRMADRAGAIESAIGAARATDIVLIAGKGHETYQEIDGVRRPFSDLDQARAALTRARARGGSA
ncbi:MAG: UDP-N-acetylmuramoyl-L-alanyl-D-glutamate--2,6-diaminopimelate ligase [Gammaproteobacteria bacterium]|nr:UDP-N-acetylmuramoyl-L-alanyl-D-glutamate--2,6-diaminopimelate ligase [Gammaproteobacteria bacterium]